MTKNVGMHQSALHGVSRFILVLAFDETLSLS